MVQAQDTNWTF